MNCQPINAAKLTNTSIRKWINTTKYSLPYSNAQMILQTLKVTSPFSKPPDIVALSVFYENVPGNSRINTSTQNHHQELNYPSHPNTKDYPRSIQTTKSITMVPMNSTTIVILTPWQRITLSLPSCIFKSTQNS